MSPTAVAARYTWDWPGAVLVVDDEDMLLPGIVRPMLAQMRVVGRKVGMRVRDLLPAARQPDGVRIEE